MRVSCFAQKDIIDSGGPMQGICLPLAFPHVVGFFELDRIPARLLSYMIKVVSRVIDWPEVALSLSPHICVGARFIMR